MPLLKIHQQKIDDPARLQAVCSFGALLYHDGQMTIGDACRLCRLCVQDPSGAITWEEDAVVQETQGVWSGIAVFAEFVAGHLHPVALELLGKARELADKSGQSVRVAAVGYEMEQGLQELRHYGADEIVAYEAIELQHFRIEPYTAALEDFVREYRPAAMLIGATAIGRSLAPRLAARFRTGLTADCTILDITESGELIQIRPAFGGNIMAEIKTPHHRPQMATVRYKVLATPVRREEAITTLCRRNFSKLCLASALSVLQFSPKPKAQDLSEAEVIIVAGRGLKQPRDLELLEALADRLGGMLAATRPLVENGWVKPHLQIGLSGRTVKPRLLITAGVSGAVQFAAGIGGAECIVAINNDLDAPIFKTAHYGLVGDLYEIVPALMEMLQ